MKVAPCLTEAPAQAGALVAGIWFNYLTSAGRFYVSAFFNLAGLILTILFVRPAFPLSPMTVKMSVPAGYLVRYARCGSIDSRGDLWWGTGRVCLQHVSGSGNWLPSAFFRHCVSGCRVRACGAVLLW